MLLFAINLVKHIPTFMIVWRVQIFEHFSYSFLKHFKGSRLLREEVNTGQFLS